MSQSTAVKNILILAMAAVIVVLFLSKGCGKTEVRYVEGKKEQIIKEIPVIEERIKVLKQVDVKYQKVYIDRVDTIYQQAPDTCTEYLDAMKLACDSVVFIKDTIISSQDSLISKLNNVNNINSAAIESCNKRYKRERRRKVLYKVVASALFLLTIASAVR